MSERGKAGSNPGTPAPELRQHLAVLAGLVVRERGRMPTTPDGLKRIAARLMGAFMPIARLGVGPVPLHPQVGEPEPWIGRRLYEDLVRDAPPDVPASLITPTSSYPVDPGLYSVNFFFLPLEGMVVRFHCGGDYYEQGDEWGTGISRARMFGVVGYTARPGQDIGGGVTMLRGQVMADYLENRFQGREIRLPAMEAADPDRSLQVGHTALLGAAQLVHDGFIAALAEQPRRNKG